LIPHALAGTKNLYHHQAKISTVLQTNPINSMNAMQNLWLFSSPLQGLQITQPHQLPDEQAAAGAGCIRKRPKHKIRTVVNLTEVL
jgi:hypothetical protein